MLQTSSKMKRRLKIYFSQMLGLPMLLGIVCVVIFLAQYAAYGQPTTPEQESSSFEKKFGLGLVTFEEKSIELRLYENPEAKNPYKTLEINKMWGFEPQHDNWLVPQIYYPEDDYFLFICRSKQSGWFEIELNKVTKKTAWVKVANGFVFKEWGELLANTYSVSTDPAINPIYEKQDTNSTKINFHKMAYIIATDYEGDWLRVYDSFGEGDPPEGHQPQSGWLRWRDTEDFLIRYSLFY